MDHMGTLAILRSSAEQVALSWEKPKPPTCRGLASAPHDGHCGGLVYKPWKTSPSLSRIHMVMGCRGHSAVGWFVVVGVARGMGPLRILQNQLTCRNHASCRRQKQNRKREQERKRTCRADGLAEGTGWDLRRTSLGLLLPW